MHVLQIHHVSLCILEFCLHMGEVVPEVVIFSLLILTNLIEFLALVFP